MSPTSRMPRDQRRAQLLDTAVPLFTQQGFQATSMDDIATAAGVTKPVLYQHFDSKEELYGEVVRVTGEQLLAGVQGLAHLEGSTAHKVRVGLDRFYRLVTEQSTLRLFTGDEHVSDEVTTTAVAVLDEAAVGLASVLLAARQMSDAQARVIGRAMIALSQSTAAMLGSATPAEREEILDAATALAVGGLTAFEPLAEPTIAGTVSSSGGAAGPGTDG